MIVPDKPIDLLADEGIDPTLTDSTTGWVSAVWEAGETATITATPEGGRIQASGLTDSTSGHEFDYVIAANQITAEPNTTYRASFRYKRLGGGIPEVWADGGASPTPLDAPVGTWATSTWEVQGASVASFQWRFMFYHALGVTDLDLIVTDFQVVEVRGFEAVRLEVGLEPDGLTNLIQNGSGEQGGYGWESPVPGSVLVGEASSWTSHRQGLRYTTAANAGGNYFYTEPVAVAAGEWARAQWHVNYTPYNAYRVRIDWLNSSLGVVGSTAWTDFTASYADHSIVAAQAPAGTSYARLRFEVGGGGVAGTYPYVYQGSNFSIRDAVMAKATTSGALADLSTTVAIDWYDVLGPTHEIRVSREDLNLGTLTATILDATLDPAVADTIRPGRPVRLTSWNADTDAQETVFRGLATAAQVKYDTRRLLADAGDLKHAKITLEAVDATQALAAANRPEGVATIRDLPYVLEGCGVPWVVNGDSNQVASADVVAINESASALDQVAITRDSDLGYAWVDRNGVLQAWATLPQPGQNLVPNGDFATDVSGWTAFDGTIAWTAQGLRLTAVGTTPVAFARAYTNPRFEVTPTATYDLSCESMAATVARSVSFYVDWWDADGNYLSSTSEDYDATTTPNAVGSWTTITATGTAPVGAAYGELVMGVIQAANGEQHYFRNVTFITQGTTVVLDEAAYSDVDVSFDTDACINEVTVRYLLLEEGGTQEVQYGPYVDTASVAEWGRHSSEFTVQGITQDPASIQAYANLILAANATPGVRVRSMRVPIRDDRDLTAAKAFLDLYDLANVVYATKGINEHSRIVGLTHTITPTGWLLDVSFTPQGSVAAPLATVSPAGRIDAQGSGPASVPIGGVQPYAGANAPFGWLLCNGQSVLVADYPALHAVIGYTFGGSGASFNVPDMRGRFPIGAGTFAARGGNEGAAESARSPRHRHTTPNHSHGDTFGLSKDTQAKPTGSGGGQVLMQSTSLTGGVSSGGASNTGYAGDDGTNAIPFMGLNFIIKV